MNPEKLEKIFRLMQDFGVEFFKHEDLEIKMSALQPQKEEQKPKEERRNKSKSKKVESQAIPPTEMVIPHKINEVTSLLKLGDEELVDKLFPDYSNAPDGTMGRQQ